MNIVIYKPKKFVDFYDPSNIENYGEEVYMMSKLLNKYDKKLKIGILSKNNIDGSLGNIYNISNILKTNDKRKVDYLIMITGYLSPNEENTILDFINAEEKILFVTDLFCVKDYNLRNYDIIITPTKPSYFNVKKDIRYFNISNLRSKFLLDNFGGFKIPSYKHKIKRGIYIGHDYFVDKFKEYVMRPKIHFYGKAKTFNIYNPIRNSRVLLTLSKYLYSPIFYNNMCMTAGLTTARLVELAIAGVVPIIDYTYFPYNNQHKLYGDLMCKDYESFLDNVDKINCDFYKFVLDRHKITIENELSNLEAKLYDVLFK